MGDDWSLLGTSSRSLALLACQIYAVYGFETYLTAPKDHDAYMPTPELSFAIRELGAAGGLNVSASAQPPGRQRVQGLHPDGRPVLPARRRDLVPGGRAGRSSTGDRAADRPATRALPRRSPPRSTASTSACTSDRSAAICASSAPVRSDRAGRVHAAVRYRPGQRRRDADRGRIPGARAARTSTRTARSRRFRCGRRTRRSPA